MDSIRLPRLLRMVTVAVWGLSAVSVTDSVESALAR